MTLAQNHQQQLNGNNDELDFEMEK
jgi:hypothetical protein